MNLKHLHREQCIQHQCKYVIRSNSISWCGKKRCHMLLRLALWAALWPLFGALGPLFGHSLGRSWAALGRSWVVIGRRSWAALGHPGPLLGGALGPFLGCTLGPLFGTCGSHPLKKNNVPDRLPLHVKTHVQNRAV